MNNKQISWIRSTSQVCVALGLIGFGAPAVAQVVPDATLGAERSRVSPDAMVRGASSTLVEGGAVRGSNLFQSFQEFNVGDGQRVYFANPIGVQNIFSRVTGANASNIFGTLGVAGGANLFLLNPNGILFGPNAQLDIRGSFLATTGDRVVFSDGNTFGASNPQASPLLTMSAPVGVQYGANATGTIQNRGNLTVGQDLTLTANKLDLQGQLQAGRDLQLQAQDTVQIRDTTTQPFLARSGRNLTIQGNQSVDILALNHPQTPIQSGGNLSLISNGIISGDAHFTSGGAFSILNLAGSPGQFISLYDPIIYANGDVVFGNYVGTALKVEATGSISGGTIKITGADTSGSIPANDPDFGLLTSGSTAILRAGVPSVPAPNVPQSLGGTAFTSSLSPPPGNIAVAQIDTSTNTPGRSGGDVILSATGSITIPGLANPRFAIGSFVGDSTGNAGNITIQAGGDITIGSDPITRNNDPVTPTIFSFGAINASITNDGGNSGNSGTVKISSTGGNINVIGGIFTNSTASIASGATSGNSGSIRLQAPQGTVKVDANPAGTIVTRTRSGGITGAAGSIDINARTIMLQGRPLSTALDVTTESTQTGSSGNIDLKSQTPLNLTNLHIGTNAKDGKSGDITIDAPSLTLNQAQLNTTTRGAGRAGNITINARDGLVLLDRGQIFSKVASADAKDAAGNIAVAAATIQLLNGSTIGTDSNSVNSSPGFVALQGRDRVEIINSKVTSDSKNDVGDFGNVLIQATEGSVLLNQATVTASNTGQAFAADLYLNAANSIEIANSVISGDGNFGRIFIGSSSEEIAKQTFKPQTVVIDHSQITATNKVIQGTQGAGIIVINATGNTFIRSSTLSGETAGVGLGGSISIDTGSLLLEQSTLNAETRGSGAAGNIEIYAQDQVALTGGKISNNLGAGAAVTNGERGNITIEAGALSITQGGVISASVNAADPTKNLPAAQGNAGTINLEIAGRTFLSGEASRIRTVVEAGAQGNSGAIALNTGSLTLDNGAAISASTLSVGNAGQIKITAQNDVLLQQGGRISSAVRSGAQGNAGTIQLASGGALRLTGDSKIEALIEAQAQGNGGNLSLSARSLTALGGAQINTGTSGLGNAGTIDITLSESALFDGVSSSGRPSGLFSTVSETANGRGGDIKLLAPNITLSNGAGITANSSAISGARLAGNLTISANVLKLNNNAFVTAETAGGGGGNIQITARDLLLLRRNSAISTTAGSRTSGGNGGNIQITAPKGFVIAVPSENSDIIANAFGGRGGTIKISANRVFGLQTRSRLTPDQLLEIRRNGTSDISASSDIGLNGDISISTLQIDPSQGLAEIPVDLIDPSSLIAQGCQPGNAANANQRSEFVITGRGGLPPSPSEVQAGSEVSVPWVSQARVTQASRSETRDVDAIAPPLVEAQGIAIAPDGAAFLTAQTVTATPAQYGFAAATCPRQ